MKKFIAVFLTVVMLMSAALIPTTATEKNTIITNASDMESVFADGEDSLIVFVTGIGQSYSYLFDESYTQEGAFETGTLQDYENYAPLIAKGDYSARWNLFNSFDEAFSDVSTITAIGSVVTGLVTSSVIGKCVINENSVKTVVRNLFKFNLVDEEFFAELKACGGKFALIRFGTAEMGFNNGCINDYTQYANEKAELCRK